MDGEIASICTGRKDFLGGPEACRKLHNRGIAALRFGKAAEDRVLEREQAAPRLPAVQDRLCQRGKTLPSDSSEELTAVTLPPLFPRWRHWSYSPQLQLTPG